MVKAYFNDIENQITRYIDSANNRIYVAVAWFTNQVLFDCLIAALKRNVKVKVLVLNDILNRSEFGLDFGNLETNGAEVWLSKPAMSLMHNKFCVIDENVITGSYNWTYYANKNSENIIISDDVDLVTDYCEQFNSLLEKGQRIPFPYEHLEWRNVEERYFSELKRNIYRDVDANASKNKEEKKSKLKELDKAYKSGNEQDLIKASNIKVSQHLRTITDVLTNRYKDFELKLWENNERGESINNIDVYKYIQKWYYLPSKLVCENNKEFIKGILQPYDYYINYPFACWKELDIYDEEFVAVMKMFNIGTDWRKNRKFRKEIPKEILLIENAKVFFYKFPYPMFNKKRNKTIPAINLFGIVKSVDGDNIIFYEGWEPKERGEKIKEKFFCKH